MAETEPSAEDADATREGSPGEGPEQPVRPGPYPALLHHQLLTPTAPLAPGAAVRVYPMLGPPVVVPATWAADPSGRHEHRWWNGAEWTEHVADGGQASVDPLP